ncbi:hypothetical protein CISIN_1g0333761mg, partial [Citrus sinensis]
MADKHDNCGPAKMND